MTLPCSIWCHLDVEGAAVRPDGWTDVVTDVPGPAVDRIRESVCDITFLLDRAAFDNAWAWLGDHQGARRAVRQLHHGQPYDFSLNTAVGRWTWTAHPVRLLPLVTTTGEQP